MSPADIPPNNPAAAAVARARRLQAGLDAESAGQLAEAVAAYRSVLQEHPDDREARRLLGVAFLRAGDAATAAEVLRPLAEDGAADAGGLLALGLACLRIGAVTEAANHFAASTERAPDSPEAWSGLGEAQLAAGDAAAAVDAFGRVRTLAPDSAPAAFNHGSALLAAGRGGDAADAFRAALQRDPDLAPAADSLGTALRALRDPDAAADAHQRAIALKPDWAGPHFNLGLARRDAGDPEGAIAAFADAAGCDPGFLRAPWNAALTLPDIYADEAALLEWRARWEAGLVALEDRFASLNAGDLPAALAAVGSSTNFFLHYQGGDDTDFQRRYGALVAKIAAQALPLSDPAPPARTRRRLAVVAHHIHRHTVWKLFAGLIGGLDRGRFEVLLFHTGRRRDADTAAAEAMADGYRNIAALGPAGQAAALAEAAPDVILYPEVGMEPAVQTLAALRLAPLQAVLFGHPVTTGLPTMDRFISAAAFEPPCGDAHYTETLAQLPGLGLRYPRPDAAAARRPDFADAVRGSGPLYVCLQSLFKLLPRHDGLFARIAAEVPGARLVFIEGANRRMTETFHTRLDAAFAAAGLAVTDHVAIVPRLDEPTFLGLCAEADVVLDSLAWSGGNTTLEALAMGTPVVTCPGAMMRSRVSAGMLHQAGLDDLVAGDGEAYIAAAASLADGEARSAAAARLANGAAGLFGDPAPTAALAEILAGGGARN